MNELSRSRRSIGAGWHFYAYLMNKEMITVIVQKRQFFEAKTETSLTITS
jgi:hypothetical protein